jgi:hypothetical protein
VGSNPTPSAKAPSVSRTGRFGGDRLTVESAAT